MIEIEFATMLEMLSKQVLPAAYFYQRELSSSIGAALEVAEQLDFIAKKAKTAQPPSIEPQAKFLTEFVEAVSSLQSLVDQMRKVRRTLLEEDDIFKKADFIVKNVLPIMQEARDISDFLEVRIDKNCWQIPTYSELLFWD